jgi:DNA modification methylase
VRPNCIITGDALQQLKKMPAGTAQAIIADPPYFNVLTKQDWDTQWEAAGEYLDWANAWTAECLRVLRDDGLCFIFGQLGKREHVFLHLMSELAKRHQFHDLLIWDRAVGYNERRDSFTPAYEMILVLRKGDKPKFNKGAVREPYSNETIQAYLRDKRYKDRDARMKHLLAGKYATNLLRVPSLKGTSKEKCGHPSQKPVDLIAKLIACSTDPGDLVLDPFLGSGTTAVVAQSLGRQWLGIEVNPLYVQLAEQRLASATDSKAEAKSPPSAQLCLTIDQPAPEAVSGHPHVFSHFRNP